MVAASRGHHNVVQSLIKARADLDLQDSFGLTALMLRILYNSEVVIQSLIEAGEDLDWQSEKGLTALVIAALYHYESGLQMLLKRGASLPTESQWTNPKVSAYWGSDKIEAAKQLINRNRNIIHERASATGEYFESEGMPADVVRLIQQIGVEGLPSERARPVPEGE